MKSKLTIGIIAHVDSGKTTLSEAILYKCGVLRKQGSVNGGDTHFDTNSIERDRGITIFSSGAVFTHGERTFNLLDTPGHVDFSPEAERVLRVIDCAVLVVSGTDGVQSHTETLWRLLESYKIPTVLFINKTDITALSHAQIMEEIKYKFGDCCVNFCAMTMADFSEELAMCSEALMERFLSGEEISDEDIAGAVSERRLFPCFFGSALKGDGVNLLLDGLTKYVRSPSYGETFGAKVYKITKDKSEKLAHVKITGGSIKVRDTISGTLPDGREFSEKVTGIRIYSGEKYRSVNEAAAGDVCALTGIASAYDGQGLGCEKDSGAAYLTPVLSYRVDLPDGVDAHTALAKFRTLEEEEPSLRISYNERLSEIYFGIMGEVQLEVLSRFISERFMMDVTFSHGSIAYRESIKNSVMGIGHYEPLRHYAEVQLLLEPLSRGEGLKFAVDPDCTLEGHYKRLIISHLYEKVHSGVLTGSPVTDIKITLMAGRAHMKHTEGGDFRQATWRAVRQGLRRAESVLLEPWYDFRLEVPQDCIGRAMTDISQLGGKMSDPDMQGDMMILSGSAPVSALRGYHRELTAYTRGAGRLFTSLHGYEECVNADEVMESIGYDPDRDLENPADSVFCAHGAGFVVKWDEVEDYKHLECGVDFSGADGSEDGEDTPARRYMSIVADNEELMRIFERTYGPIKRKNFNEPKVKSAIPERKRSPSPKKAPAKIGKEYLLVDGYNIIYSWDDLKKLSEESLDLARSALVTKLCSYQGFKRYEVIIVFDAYKVKRNPGEVETLGGVTVVYTKEAETADTYIERVTSELAKEHRVRVATSDGTEQLIILGSGATRLSAAGLLAEVREVDREIRAFMSEA